MTRSRVEIRQISEAITKLNDFSDAITSFSPNLVHFFVPPSEIHIRTRVTHQLFLMLCRQSWGTSVCR